MLLYCVKVKSFQTVCTFLGTNGLNSAVVPLNNKQANLECSVLNNLSDYFSAAQADGCPGDELPW